MTLDQIKDALRNGTPVHWKNEAYTVTGNPDTGNMMIYCSINGSAIGLTWTDGVTMNGKEEDFYTKASP